jgi:hypothetical protein
MSAERQAISADNNTTVKSKVLDPFRSFRLRWMFSQLEAAATRPESCLGLIAVHKVNKNDGQSRSAFKPFVLVPAC